ncbi:MAG: trypsin-like peptidase domain-containing protein [Planctomycetales bacterium]
MTVLPVRCCRWCPLVLLSLVAPAVAAPPQAAALEEALVEAIAKAERSVVSVARIKAPRAAERSPFDQIGRPPLFRQQPLDPDSPDFIPNDFGAGILFAPEGRPNDRLVLTNHHVVKGGPPVGDNTAEYRLYLRFPNRRGCYAEVVAADPRSDLAVLRPDFAALGVEARQLAPIEFADPSRLRKGRLVVALGNPYAIARDGSPSASWGMISNIARRPASFEIVEDRTELKKESIHHLGTLLQVDARLEFGTSGGALVDLDGRLLGITTSLAAIDGYEKSAGYAVPVDEATRRVIDTLAQGYEVEYGFLGVTPGTLLPTELRQRYSYRFEQASAAVAAAVIPGSPASGINGQRGLMSGDVILAIGEKPISEPDSPGRPIHDKNDLMREVALLPPGTVAHLSVWRESARRKLNLEVKLGKWPPYDDEGIIATRRRHDPWRGAAVDHPTGRQQFMPYPQFVQAVVVTEVAPGSPAARADLRPGDFITYANDQPVASPDEFHQAVANTAGNVAVMVLNRGRVVVSE